MNGAEEMHRGVQRSRHEDFVGRGETDEGAEFFETARPRRGGPRERSRGTGGSGRADEQERSVGHGSSVWPGGRIFDMDDGALPDGGEYTDERLGW